MVSRTGPIGVFDSGVGGISVLRQLKKAMPGEDFLYFGDCGNAPYGIKDTETVRALTMDAAEMLFDAGVKALVVACNTATAAAIETLRSTWPDRIIIGIEPAVMLAEHQYPEGRLAVMATPLTLQLEKYRHLLTHVHSDVVSIPVKGLVELVEDGKAASPEAEDLLREILTPYVGKLDCLVLGCTHYPFAANTIGKILGPSTRLVDGGEGTASQTLRRLREAGLLNPQESGTVTFRFSGSDTGSAELAQTLMTADIPEHL